MGTTSGKIRGRLALAALAFTAGAGVTSLAAGTAGAAAASGSPITLVMITSLTGEGSSEFSNAPAGFNARIALQNAQGGIDGHKINGVVLDDQTSPTQIATAAASLGWMFCEWLISKKPSVLGIISGAVAGLVAITPASGFVNPMGALIIGDTPSLRLDPMPFGGVKDSGLGREGVRSAIEEMTEPRMLVMSGIGQA